MNKLQRDVLYGEIPEKSILPANQVNNSIMAISPYRWNGVWAFDDESTGLVRELLVGGADTFMDKISNGASQVTVIFSPSPFPGYEYKVDKIEQDGFGTTYFHEETNHTLWLCPALWKYIATSPDSIFISVKPIN